MCKVCTIKSTDIRNPCLYLMLVKYLPIFSFENGEILRQITFNFDPPSFGKACHLYLHVCIYIRHCNYGTAYIQYWFIYSYCHSLSENENRSGVNSSDVMDNDSLDDDPRAVR